MTTMTGEAWHETLGGLDASFLHFEDRTAHMHVGSVAVFEGAPPSYEEFVAHVSSRLARVPRYRQRLAFVPLSLGRPAWVDDDAFDVEYHVRHTALPAPGGAAALKKLAARLFSQRLDRDKPLWELWLVENVALHDDNDASNAGNANGASHAGTGANGFAIISKTHHCMIDGISGVDLASVLLDVDARVPDLTSEPAWVPRPVPKKRALLASSLREQARTPSLERAKETAKILVGGVKPLASLVAAGRAPASSLNQELGPHRRWETLSLPLADVKAVRAGLGGTVNDVVLAVVAGGLRSLLLARGEPLVEDLRVMVPVSLRPQQDRGKLGNQVAAIFCPLPVTEKAAVARLRAVGRAMAGLKENKQAVGALALTRLSDFAPPTLAAQAARLSVMDPWFNLVVTNVPGPQHPLHLRGKKMLACHPLVPLGPRQTLGIALLSYDGDIDVGLLGDADRTRDLPDLAGALRAALAELVVEAGKAQ